MSLFTIQVKDCFRPQWRDQPEDYDTRDAAINDCAALYWRTKKTCRVVDEEGREQWRIPLTEVKPRERRAMGGSASGGRPCCR